MFNVWGNVFMMRVRALENWIVRVRLGIVPVQFLLTLPNLVTIPVYDGRHTMKENSLPHNKPNVLVKPQLPGYAGQRCSSTDERHCRASHRGELLNKCV